MAHECQRGEGCLIGGIHSKTNQLWVQKSRMPPPRLSPAQRHSSYYYWPSKPQGPTHVLTHLQVELFWILHKIPCVYGRCTSFIIWIKWTLYWDLSVRIKERKATSPVLATISFARLWRQRETVWDSCMTPFGPSLITARFSCEWNALLLFTGPSVFQRGSLRGEMWGCSSNWKKWALWVRGDSCEWWQRGLLLQARGAGEEVCRGRCLLVQAFPLLLWVYQFFAVPTNPETPTDWNQLQTLCPNTIHKSHPMHSVSPLLLHARWK